MAECRFCHKRHFKLHKLNDSMNSKGFRWELYDPISEDYHDQHRCQQIEEKRKKAEEKAKREARMKPLIVHKRTDYFKTEHFDKPVESDFGVKKMCYCKQDECYPTMIQQPHYYFDTDELLRTDYIFWCSLCGYFLTTKQIEMFFNEELLSINKWR